MNSGVLPQSSRRFLPLAIVFGLSLGGFLAPLANPIPAIARSKLGVTLKLQRRNGFVTVVVAGLGEQARIVSQSSNGSTWRSRVRGNDGALLASASQQMSISGFGLVSIRQDVAGSDFELNVEAVEGINLPAPKIIFDGRDLLVSFSSFGGSPVVRQDARLDLRRPGRVPQPAYVPPLRPRAVAPPVGDMAVGTMLIENRSFVNVSGPNVSLALNNSPAKDALMSLARLGGYGFVYVGQADSSDPASGPAEMGTVTMAFRNERFDRALNSVLLASGLQAKLDGRTLMVGTSVSAKTFGAQMSKVFRMNQVDVNSASQYLGNLGASIKVTNTSTTTARETESAGTSSNSSESTVATTSETSTVETYGSGVGPLLGLVGTTDGRLNTITLVGDPQLISIAQSYLKQIDLRKRQVAVKIQILSVTLNNDASIDSSFSAKIGNNFIVSESGTAHMNFGKYKPGDAQIGTGLYDGSEYAKPGFYPSNVPMVQAQEVKDPFITKKDGSNPIVITERNESGEIISQDITYPEIFDKFGRPEYVRDSNPNAEKQLVPRVDSKGRPIYVPASDPNQFKYPKNSFYSYLESVIISSSAKTIAQPTLLVQEGEKATVKSGENVITGVSKTDASNGSTQFNNTREDAGLTVDVEVDKIDDNGFVTMRLDPTISVPVTAGTQEGVQIFNIAERKLNSGKIRLRDRQTLILTGVITESDRQLVSKWPVLGDLPLIGQLFRSSDSSREKTELVIIVTPVVLDDQEGGRYGYGYRTGTEAATTLLRLSP